jgi:bacterioferritin
MDEKLHDMLNQAIARELQVSIQYMWQHVMGKGLESPAVRAELRKISIVEMKHAEDIAERLNELGGEPTTKPQRITIGTALRDMIQLDRDAEAEAVRLYKGIIKYAREIEDPTTAHLFEGILAAEEEHLQTFEDLLER